jgi:hypothetical protein
LIAELDALGRPAKSTATSEPGGAIPQGQRNSTLTSWGGSLRRRGASEQEINDMLRVLNRRCQPLPDEDLATIAGSVARYAPDDAQPIGQLLP